MDGPVKQSVVLDGDQVVNQWLQPGRRSLLEKVRAIRDERAARTLSWGRPELEIPLLDYEVLCQKNPDLRSLDGATKLRAWKKFLASPESLPYRVHQRGHSLPRVFGGLEHGR